MIGGNRCRNCPPLRSAARRRCCNLGMGQEPQCRHRRDCTAETMGQGNTFEYRTGFTLLEMIISIGIFSVLVIASIGVMIGISNAQIKASTAQATQDNIRFGVELMTKELRTGSRYDISGFCGAGPGEAVRFTASSGTLRTYYRRETTLMRLTDSANCDSAQPVLSEEVAVLNLLFRAGGTQAGATDGQPWISVSLSIRSRGPKPAFDSQMDLQTTVVQRFRDQ